MMKTAALKQKIFVTGLAALMFAALAFSLVANPGVAAAASKVVIKFSHNNQVNTPVQKAALMFEQLVEERTKGYYDVQTFPAMQLGSMRDQVEATVMGTVESVLQPSAVVSLFSPKVMVLDFPFLWTTEDAMWKVLDGPLGQELLAGLEAKGLKGLDYWSSGWKVVTTGKKAIRTPDDFKGTKMRVMPSPLLSAQYEAWGASPTPVDFKELYTALQQGLVDGQENPPGTVADIKLYEVQKFMTMSRHGFLHYIAAFNKKWFDAQPKANQDILAQALREAGRWERKAIVEHDGEAVKKIRESGVQVIEITPAAREQFRQLSLKVHDKFVDSVGKDYLKKLYTEIERASK